MHRAGQCLLEWEGEGRAPLPLLKDMFASERRKAKVLNFSIAYGKTAHGLSKDWKVSLDEATETVKRWYSDRPEVERWQERQRAQAVDDGFVTTILGRRRNLPDAFKHSTASKAAKSHALRAAINTPIQGSAADIATAAMLRINADPELQALGWRLLLQVRRVVGGLRDGRGAAPQDPAGPCAGGRWHCCIVHVVCPRCPAPSTPPNRCTTR